jgi:hypothetical protein
MVVERMKKIDYIVHVGGFGSSPALEHSSLPRSEIDLGTDRVNLGPSDGIYFVRTKLRGCDT